MPKQNEKEQNDGLNEANSKKSILGGFLGNSKENAEEKPLLENKKKNIATKKPDSQKPKTSSLFGGVFPKKKEAPAQTNKVEKKEAEKKVEKTIDQKSNVDKKPFLSNFFGNKKLEQNQKIDNAKSTQPKKTEAVEVKKLPETKSLKVEKKGKTSLASFFNLSAKKDVKDDTKTSKTAEKIETNLQEAKPIVKTDVQAEKKSKQEKKNEKKEQVPTKDTPSGLLSKFFQKGAKSETGTEKSDEGEKKNLFVDLFPQEVKKNEDDSLIETIVEQSDKQPSILGQKLRNKKQEEEKNEDKKEKEEKNELLFWSQITLTFSLLLPLIVYTYFYFQTTSQSKVLDMLGVENMGMVYVEKQAERDELKQYIKKTQTAIKKLEETSRQNLLEKTIAQIKTETNDWLLVMENITEVTNRGIRYNDLLKRVVYDSYNFALKDNKITLSAKIFDPNQQAFNLATSLIDAFNNSEYFEGLENRNFAKSIAEEGAEMSLSMNFNYIPSSLQTLQTSVLDDEDEDVESGTNDETERQDNDTESSE